MNGLVEYLVENIVNENDEVKDIVVVYSGRFQPFHTGHYMTYKHLTNKFGNDNVFIATSNKTDNDKSPLNFKEKSEIMKTMFGISPNKIVEVKNPYTPTEILKKYNEKTTAFITVVGEKDSNRLGGKYFEKWKDGGELQGYRDKGYVYIAPSQANGISGTQVRNGLSNGSIEDKQNFFKKIYGKFDKKIFDLITKKLNEGVLEIKKHTIEDWLIRESSTGFFADADDGPTMFTDFKTHKKISIDRAKRIGYTVVGMILRDELEDFYDKPIYPNGPTPTVSFYPAGVIGALTANNPIDIYSDDAYDVWYKHITRVATQAGYQIIDSNSAEDRLSDIDYLSTKYLANLLKMDESIYFPLSIGDEYICNNKVKIVEKFEFMKNNKPVLNGKVVDKITLKDGKFYIKEAKNINEDKMTLFIIPALVKIIGLLGSSVLVALAKVFIGPAMDFLSNRVSIAYKVVKDWVAPEAYLKFIKGLEKNDKFNREFIQFTLEKNKNSFSTAFSWSMEIVKLPTFVEAFSGFIKENNIDKRSAALLENEIRREFERAYLYGWKDIVKWLKKKYPDITKDLTEGILSEIPMADLIQIDKYADKQLNPVDIVITDKHFMDRLVDPRNIKPISSAELIGFFKRLSRKKREFIEFLNKYKEIVAKDSLTNINIPFMKKANRAIAKTIMRKQNFMSPDPKFNIESVGNITEGITNAGIKAYYNAVAKAEGVKPLPLKFGRVGKGGAATTYNAKTMTPLYISFDITRMSDPEFAVLHELTHQIKLETEKDAYQGKRDQLAKFKKLENYLIDKYAYSSYSSLIFNTKK